MMKRMTLAGALFLCGATPGIDPPGAQRFTVEDITPRSQDR